MITYQYTKKDGTIWYFFYDKSVRLWTVFEVSEEGFQISLESDYYNDKQQLIHETGFNFKNRVAR